MTLKDAIRFIEFLDDLRSSGTTNMFGAGVDLREEFGITKAESHKVLGLWMNMDRKRPAINRARELAFLTST